MDRICEMIVQLADRMAGRRISYSDETVVTLRQELANLREELARLHKEDDLKKQNLGKAKEEIEHLRSTLKDQSADMESIKEKLRDSRFKETRTRVSKELLSVKLVMKNADNRALVNETLELEKAVERLKANEEEKLLVVNRQREALSKAYKLAKIIPGGQPANAQEIENKLNSILSGIKVQLPCPEDNKITSILSDAQENIASMVDSADQILNHALYQHEKRNEDSDEEIMVTTIQKLRRKRKFHSLEWRMETESITVSAPEEEQREVNPSTPHSVEPAQFEDLDEMLRSLREGRSAELSMSNI